MPSRGKPFPPEVRERAVRMVLEHQGNYESQWAAITSIARPGLSAEERRRLRELERENRELRRANDMAGSGGGRNGLCVGL